MSKIEKGDMVSAKGEVVELDGQGNIKVEFGGQLTWFGPDKLTLVKKRPLQVGDVVIIDGFSCENLHKIAAIVDDAAWLKPANIAAVRSIYPNGFLMTLDRLSRVS